MNMFGNELKPMYAKMNARNYFIQKRKYLLENFLLDYVILYSILREKMKKKQEMNKVRKKIDEKKEEVNIGGKVEEAIDDLKTSKRKADQEIKKIRKVQVDKESSLLTTLADPLNVLFVLIESFLFPLFIREERQILKICELKTNEGTDLLIFFFIFYLKMRIGGQLKTYLNLEINNP